MRILILYAMLSEKSPEWTFKLGKVWNFVVVFVAESPLQFYVNHASSPNVTAYGPGLSYGVANKMASFTVYTEDAYEGTALSGGGKYNAKGGQ